MVESDKLKEKAAELAAQAAAAAGPLVERAGELAHQAAAAAGPLAAQARERASELAVQAGPMLERASQAAAHGLNTAAENLDRVTGGKYSGQISTVSAKIEQQLERAQQRTQPKRPSGPVSTPPEAATPEPEDRPDVTGS